MNKTVFITGCANGIGKALVERFYSLGYRVIATDIDFDKLKSHSWDSSKVSIYKLDVTNPEEWYGVVAAVIDKFGQIDVLINNAGVIIPAFIHDFTIKDVDFHIDINLKGVIYGSKIVSDLMLKQGSGHIINIASLAGVAPIQGLSLYSASKFAVRGFTLSIAQELKPRGIFVSVVCPDLVDTNMLKLQLDYEAANLTFSGNKVLTVNDIADAIIHRAINQKEVEILIPRSRGFLAKIGNFFPSMADFLTKTLSKKGNQKRLELKNSHRSS